MSGHSHWSGIKHKKGITDQKRGLLFSKLLAAVTAAAKTEPNPDFNPRLRTAVETAKDNKVPLEKIEAAIKRALDKSVFIEELILEGYGPGGSAILIEAVTDSRNRTIPEIKHIFSSQGAKWAEPGSVLWAFEKKPGQGGGWQAKFYQEIPESDQEKLLVLLSTLDEHPDVQEIYTNLPS